VPPEVQKIRIAWSKHERRHWRHFVRPLPDILAFKRQYDLGGFPCVDLHEATLNSADRAWKLIERYVVALGLDVNVTVHALRVTALTTARERGSDSRKRAQYGGILGERLAAGYSPRVGQIQQAYPRGRRRGMTSLILSLAIIGQYPDTRDMMRQLQTDINANSIAGAQPARSRSQHVFSYE
jgi:hypothetical protein